MAVGRRRGKAAGPTTDGRDWPSPRSSSRGSRDLRGLRGQARGPVREPRAVRTQRRAGALILVIGLPTAALGLLAKADVLTGIWVWPGLAVAMLLLLAVGVVHDRGWPPRRLRRPPNR